MATSSKVMNAQRAYSTKTRIKTATALCVQCFTHAEVLMDFTRRLRFLPQMTKIVF